MFGTIVKGLYLLSISGKVCLNGEKLEYNRSLCCTSPYTLNFAQHTKTNIHTSIHAKKNNYYMSVRRA